MSLVMTTTFSLRRFRRELRRRYCRYAHRDLWVWEAWTPGWLCERCRERWPAPSVAPARTRTDSYEEWLERRIAASPMAARREKPPSCPADGRPFCDECCEDVADASELKRVVVGPHPITGDIGVLWVHRNGCPCDAKGGE